MYTYTIICIWFDNYKWWLKEIIKIKKLLFEFKMTNIGSILTYFWIKFKYFKIGTTLYQKNYINIIFDRFETLDCNPSATSMNERTKL